MSAAKVELGRYLFYDKRMSVNGKESCGSCHRQELAFTDGRPRAEGTTGQVHPRSSMSLVNVAYAPLLTWANPTLDSLEEQALIPMLGEEPVELGLKGREQEFLNTLRRDPVYRRLFPQAFPEAAMSTRSKRHTRQLPRSNERLSRCGRPTTDTAGAATRRRSRIRPSEGSCYSHQASAADAFSAMEAGISAQSDSKEIRIGRWRSRGGFFNTGVSQYLPPNRGLFEHTQRAEDIGKFRAPTLRNIALTAPYMHDGSLATLEDVIDHYAAGGKMDHPNKSRILRHSV